MIVKQVAAGAKTAGLLAYLYGPGIGEARGGTVHVNPRTVGSWDGQPGLHRPTHRSGGRVSIGPIARTLDVPVALTERSPMNHVGHIVVANHPEDPVLSDQQWQRIATDVMRRAGLARGPGDPDGVRWVAVRHDDTSIHIAYTKVRESGRPQGYVNYTRAWEQLRHDWETRLGLTPTGRADGGSRRPYGRAEFARAKAQRAAGNHDARPDSARLRRECRLAAMTSNDHVEFVQRLTDRSVTVQRSERGLRVGTAKGPLRDLAQLDPSR